MTMGYILLSLILQPTILVPIFVGMLAVVIGSLAKQKYSKFIISNKSMAIFIAACYLSVVITKILLLSTLFANTESYTSNSVLLIHKGALTAEAYKSFFKDGFFEVVLMVGWFLVLKIANKLPNLER